MDYEELYASYQVLEKEFKEKLALVQKLQKLISKEMENGDLKSVARDTSLLETAVQEEARLLAGIKSAAAAFDGRSYFQDGAFARQMLAECEASGVDVKGEYPVYEMFPYKVKIDAENQDLYLDRKKLPCMRPRSFVKVVKAGRDKLMKASFNALTFANELGEAYDMALLKQKKQPGADLYLANLYPLLAPMGRYRRDYDQQSYAFDLARLYISGTAQIKDGRCFQFGPSRNNSKAIRILDGEGHEQYLATIRFYPAD